MTQYWKLLTSDLRPPIQGGDPLFDGNLPFTTPEVECDITGAECSFGWNFVRDIQTGFKIAGMWRTGRPNAVLLVEPVGDVITVGDKSRAASLKLIRHASDDEIRAALSEFSKSFGTHREAMAEEQWLWWQALKRPLRDHAAVEVGLRAALATRGLDWTIKEYQDARDAWAAWAARAARAAWAAWDAWDAWAAWAAWDAWDAWAARAAWDARDAWDAWAARAAWAALTVSFAARSGWISLKHEHLTIGIRDAYLNGLAIALPTGSNELGYAMERGTISQSV